MSRKYSFEVGDTVIIHAKVTDQGVIDDIVESIFNDTSVKGLIVSAVDRCDLKDRNDKERLKVAKDKIFTALESLIV